MKNKHLRFLTLVSYAAIVGSLLAPAPTAAQTAPSPSQSPTATPSPNEDPLLPVYRFHSPTQGNAHFFTMDEAERNNILRFDNYDTGGNWRDEGIGYWAHASSLGSCGEVRQPVYRYRSDRFQTHFYTANPSEMQALTNDPNWRYEQLAYCGEPRTSAGVRPLQRYWSDRFQKHFFTANSDEQAVLRTDANWRPEGIATYVY